MDYTKGHDRLWVDVLYYTAMRSFQMENLHQYDKDEWPSTSLLVGYKSRAKPDIDYYYPNDLFIELGEWLRDKNIARSAKSKEDPAKGRVVKAPVDAFTGQAINPNNAPQAQSKNRL